MPIFAVPFEKMMLLQVGPEEKIQRFVIGVWRSWLAHLVWDQRVLCSSHSTPTE